MYNVTVLEIRSNKFLLSWSPGHDGYSPLTKCHIRVSHTSAQAAPPYFFMLSHWSSCSLLCLQVKEVSLRKGEVMTTRFVNVTVPPFQSEIPGLQALTPYNMSVSCSNEVGVSPVSIWIQSNTTEGGVFRNHGTISILTIEIHRGGSRGGARGVIKSDWPLRPHP